jgi:ADP-L-glycero-D-manno-heptose 6-epimerase
VIIVTGAAGFIGSNLVRALNAQGKRDILLVDNLRRGEKHLNLNRLRFADYCDKDDLFEVVAGIGDIEAILHQGACSDTTESDGRYMMKNNYEYSKRLLAIAEQRGAKFLYASSAAVYGAGDCSFSETSACECPLNVYGFSKLAFDNFVRQRIEHAPQQIVGLRYFNVYGPGERHKGRMASVAQHFYDQLGRDGTMRLFEGSAGFRRDFIHVDDVVAVNLYFLGNAKRGIFNCGSGQPRSFVDVASCLRSAHGSGEIAFVPFPEDLRGKYQRFTQADLTQLRAAGYDRPFCTLDAGIERYYRALQDG